MRRGAVPQLHYDVGCTACCVDTEHAINAINGCYVRTNDHTKMFSSRQHGDEEDHQQR
jgi:hypothetical protein